MAFCIGCCADRESHLFRPQGIHRIDGGFGVLFLFRGEGACHPERRRREGSASWRRTRLRARHHTTSRTGRAAPEHRTTEPRTPSPFPHAHTTGTRYGSNERSDVRIVSPSSSACTISRRSNGSG